MPNYASLEQKGGPQGGTFDDLDALAQAAGELSGTVPGVYEAMIKGALEAISLKFSNDTVRVDVAPRSTRKGRPQEYRVIEEGR